MPRVFVRPEAVDADRVRFDADEAHHLRRVLQAPARGHGRGDRRDRPPLHHPAGRPRGRGRVGDHRGAAPEPARESPCAITLAQAILKGDRMSWLVQKATELGVARIVPMETARVVARPGAGAPARHAALGADRARGRQAVRAGRRAGDRPAARVRGGDAVRSAGHDAAWVCWEGGGQAARRGGGRTRARRAASCSSSARKGASRPTRSARPKRRGRAGQPRAADPPRRVGGAHGVALCQFLFGDLGGRGSGRRRTGRAAVTREGYEYFEVGGGRRRRRLGRGSSGVPPAVRARGLQPDRADRRGPAAREPRGGGARRVGRGARW